MGPAVAINILFYQIAIGHEPRAIEESFSILVTQRAHVVPLLYLARRQFVIIFFTKKIYVMKFRFGRHALARPTHHLYYIPILLANVHFQTVIGFDQIVPSIIQASIRNFETGR